MSFPFLPPEIRASDDAEEEVDAGVDVDEVSVAVSSDDVAKVVLGLELPDDDSPGHKTTHEDDYNGV